MWLLCPQRGAVRTCLCTAVIRPSRLRSRPSLCCIAPIRAAAWHSQHRWPHPCPHRPPAEERYGLPALSPAASFPTCVALCMLTTRNGIEALVPGHRSAVESYQSTTVVSVGIRSHLPQLHISSFPRLPGWRRSHLRPESEVSGPMATEKKIETCTELRHWDAGCRRWPAEQHAREQQPEFPRFLHVGVVAALTYCENAKCNFLKAGGERN